MSVPVRAGVGRGSCPARWFALYSRSHGRFMRMNSNGHDRRIVTRSRLGAAAQWLGVGGAFLVVDARGTVRIRALTTRPTSASLRNEHPTAKVDRLGQ